MSLQSYRSHFEKTFLIAYPVMVSQLGHILVGVADSVMVGKLGAQPLAAVSLGTSIFSLVLTFGIGVSMAITPLVAAADGEGSKEMGGEVFRHGLVINLVAGLLLCAIVIATSFLLYYFDQPQAVVDLTIPYLSIIAVSLIPFMFFQSFKQYAEGLSYTRTAMYITVSANILNVALNYLLIYGKWGLPALGLNGAGWATLISRIAMGLAMMAYAQNTSWYQSRKVHIRQQLSRLLVKRILRLGIPTGMQYIFEVGAFSFASIMMGWIGTKALAAHQIALNLAAISYMVVTGLAAAATVRVGNQLGMKDIPNMWRAGFTAMLMGWVLMIFSATVFIVFRHTLPMFYIDEMEVVELAASLLVIAAFFQLSDGSQAVGLGLLRGMADVKIPTVITLFAYWIVALPLGYWLAFKLEWGPQGIWIGLLTGLSVAAVLLFIRFQRFSKRLLHEHTTAGRA